MGKALANRAEFLLAFMGAVFDDRKIPFAVFFITDKCNARCSFCFTNRSGSLEDQEDHGRSPTLTLKEYEQIACRLKSLFHASFSGGEPFLRDDIDEIVKVFYDISRTRLFSIPTNGSLGRQITDKLDIMLRACPKATFNIQVSLDAPLDRHDKLRQLPGCFDKATQLLEDMLDLEASRPNLNTVINTVVTEDTIDDIEALRDYLDERFGCRMPLHNIQYDQRQRAKIFSHPDLVRKIIHLEESLEEKPEQTLSGFWRKMIDRYYIRHMNSLVICQMLSDKMVYSCNAGGRMFVMTSDGRVSPCEPFLFHERYQNFPKYDIRDFGYDINNIMLDPQYKEMIRFAASRKCAACPWSCAAITSMVYSPRNWRLFLSLPKPSEIFSRKIGR